MSPVDRQGLFNENCQYYYTNLHTMTNTVVYIFDKALLEECNRLPVALQRASIVQDLINGYNILAQNNTIIVASKPATEDELKLFHSSSYVDFIKKVNEEATSDTFGDEQEEFGLEYDCPLLPNMYKFVQTLAGGSLTAAKELMAGRCSTAINWFGGWHHAQRDEAEGFCYVNDVVIAIQKLTEIFPKVLYIDLDIHHGNGVQNAFEYSKRIVTLSFHKFSPGFYPGSGGLDDIGCGSGKFHSLNVPLMEGCSNTTFIKCFTEIFPRVLEAFRPAVIVVQCGADGINGDPVGETSLTPKGMGVCIQKILDCKLPLLFVGGGGYNFTNTARYWAYLTSLIVGVDLDPDIPDSCQYFPLYKPSFELHITEGNQKDCNTEKHIEKVITTLLEYCDYIRE